MACTSDRSSWLLDKSTDRYSDQLRSQFTTIEIPTVNPTKGHSHGVAASARSSAVSFMDAFALSVGLTPYQVSMSMNDIRLGREGNRSYYNAKDTSIPYRFDPVSSMHLLCLVDVDYYVDMPSMLLAHNNSVLMYTVTPEDVGGVTENSVFCFRDGIYEERVKGGAFYQHSLWDYSGDYVTVSGWVGWKYVRKMYKIEKRKVSPSRSLVLLQLTSLTHCCGLLFGPSIDVKPLQRLRVMNGGFNVLRVLSDDMYVSIARNGSSAGVRVPIQIFDALLSVQSVCKKQITKATVESYLKEGSKVDAAIITDMLHNADTAAELPTSVSNDIGVASYQYVKVLDVFEQDAPDTMCSFMDPFLGESPAPSDCRNNDIRTVDKRINEIKHTKPRPVSKFTYQVIKEFVDFLVTSEYANTLVPFDTEEVYERQNRPTQVALLDSAVELGDHTPRVTISSFMKRESYGKVTDPRNISTFPPLVKLDYARFIYAVSEYMKDKGEFSWYAFGRTPLGIALDVARICKYSDEVVVTDYSRMDGRKSNISRLVFRSFLMRLFKPEYHEELDKLLKLQFNRVGWTKHGIRYESGETQASGGVDTSLSNSVDCAFGAYLGARYAGMPPAEAQSFLVTRLMVGGDDAIMGDISSDRVVAAAKTVGHVLTFDVYKRGDPGVNFLSRIYSPDVWYGAPFSMCDIRRQLLKFHTTPIRGVNYAIARNCLDKLKEKCVSFYLTDPNTPVLGAYCKKVLGRIGPIQVNTGMKAERWWSRFEREVQFPQDEGGWMMDVLRTSIPNVSLSAFSDWLLEEVKHPEDLLHPPRVNDEFLEFEPPEDCVVNDRVGPMTNITHLSNNRTRERFATSTPLDGINEGVSLLGLKGQQHPSEAGDHAWQTVPKDKKKKNKRRGKGRPRQTKRSARGRPDKAHA
jgi:hypothetical protein